MVRFFDNTEENTRWKTKANEARELMEYIFGDYFKVNDGLILGIINIYEERDDI